jgi:curved DNA-binding protein
MEVKDYYQILGVTREADAKEIRRAYRRLARQVHPDVNPGDPAAEERFKEITEVLSDPEKREKYDRFGAAWGTFERSGQAGGFDWSGWAQAAGGPGGQYTYTTVDGMEELFGRGGFSEFFETLFGGGGGHARRAPGRGRDLEQPVRISLAEAYGGTKRRLDKDGRRLEVTIPPGVKTGSRVRMAGEGLPGAGGGQAGDLYLAVEVTADPRFERRGDDLFTEIEVPLVMAVLGGEAPVPTPAGEVTLTIPPETPNGRVFRLAGMGMPTLADPSRRGDLYATVKVRLPVRLTEEERGLFERLRTLRGPS